ncbi:acyl-CoA thioesterase [Shumkonia mesophila]|uniref:acyl-CoA thioesterase n=1 Tax=Shumkonia mesophila TaxID=2838854 RepID=UPI0037429824
MFSAWTASNGRRPSQHAPQTYEYDLDVAAADIDEMGHVNNAVHLTWVQVAVLRHWNRIAPKEAVAGHLWVALKHEIRYRHRAETASRCAAARWILIHLYGTPPSKSEANFRGFPPFFPGGAPSPRGHQLSPVSSAAQRAAFV